MEAIQLTSRYDYKGKQKRYERTYAFYDDAGQLYTTCDVYGACISAPTAYSSTNHQNMNFAMVAKGKLMNATYFLENPGGTRFAAITRKGVGFRWKILGQNEQEIARIIDPASRKEAFFRTLLSAQPNSYAVMSNEDLIAVIKKEDLHEGIRIKPKNVIGKFLDKVIPQRGLTIRFESRHTATVDHRALVAGMTLLDVHDIKGVNRQ